MVAKISAPARALICLAPSQGSINQSVREQIQLTSVQRLFYKDGERISSVDGVSLLTTQLILDIDSATDKGRVSLAGRESNSSTLTADIELKLEEEIEDGDVLYSLQLVILESLVLRRDSDADPFGGNIQTRLLVSDGQEIPKNAVVARTEIQCKEAGSVRGLRSGTSQLRRILLVRDADLLTLKANGSLKVKKGDLVVAGREIAPGFSSSSSGQVVGISLDEAEQCSKVTLRLARPYRVSAGAVLHIDNGDLVQRGDNLVLLVFERAKTGDIIQGLPRIEELLEARKPKEACLLNRSPGICQVEIGVDESKTVKIIESDGSISEYPLSPGLNPMVSDSQHVEIGERLTDGPANPHEILEVFFDYYVNDKGVYEAALIGFQQAQNFLVNQVQSVYQSQGIDISDKHIEVIVRQMTSKVKVDDGGDTTMLPGELVELRQIEQVNEAMAITGGAPARYTPVLLGITKASLNTDSFISAASFQETTRVLTEAAIKGKSDWLRGLKENVIIGRLIPAGTGFNAHQDSDVPDGEADRNYANDGASAFEGIGIEEDFAEDPTFGAPVSYEEESNYGDVVLDDLSARVLENDFDLSFSSVTHPMDDAESDEVDEDEDEDFDDGE